MNVTLEILPLCVARSLLCCAAAAPRSRGLAACATSPPPAEMPRFLRADIGRRLAELRALGWLGRAFALAPRLVEAALPSVFRHDVYYDWQLCFELPEGAFECTLRESSCARAAWWREASRSACASIGARRVVCAS